MDKKLAFSTGSRVGLNLHQTEFICMSIDKNYLHCYQVSTIYRVVQQFKYMESTNSIESDNLERCAVNDA